MNIVLLAGSPSSQSRSTRLLHHIGDKITLLGFRTARLSVRDLPAEALLHADFQHPAIKATQQQIRLADAVIVSTPVYQAAYSGVLKAFLDLLPQNGLEGKLALPLATGGSQSHMLALDYALRPVLSAFGAKHILQSIYATEAQIEEHAGQGLLLDKSIAERVTGGILHLTASLSVANGIAVPAAQEFDLISSSQRRCGGFA